MGGAVLLVSERTEVLLGTKWRLESAGLSVSLAENSAEAEAALSASPGEFGLVLVGRPLILGSAAELTKKGLPVVGFTGTPLGDTAPGPGESEVEKSAYSDNLPAGAVDPAALVSKYGLTTATVGAKWEGVYNPVAVRGKRVLHVTTADEDSQRYLHAVLQYEGLVVTEVAAAPVNVTSFDVLLTSCSEEGLAAVRAASALPAVAISTDASSSDLHELFREAGVTHVLPFPRRRAALIEAVYKATNPTNPPVKSELHARVRDPPLDVADLLEQFQGDWEFLQDLLTCFLEEGVQRMEKLLQASVANNMADIKFVSHTMKGSSRSCCLMDIGNLFADLENLPKSKTNTAEAAADTHLVQNVNLLASLCQQSFLHIMDFDYCLQNIKVLDVPAGLEACEGNWEELSSELLTALRQGLTAVDKRDSSLVPAVITPSTIEHVSSVVYNAAMDVLEFGEDSFPTLEAAMLKLQSDVCLLLGRKALP